MSSLEKLEKSQVKISMQATAEEFESYISDAYRKNAHRFSVQGFRRGKAPRKVIENFYGEGVFYEDAFNELFADKYEIAVKENDIVPVDRPSIEVQSIDRTKGVDFTAIVTVKPEAQLGVYKGIELPLVEYTVKDEDVEREIGSARERVGRMVSVEDRPVKDGDQVTLDYSGSIDGVKFAGGTAQDQLLVIGSGTFIPGFEEQIAGMTLGQEKDITVKFPDDYGSEEFKGREAVFAIKIKGIKEKQLPDIDDEFAKDVSEFETLEQYKADIRRKLTEQYENRAKTEMENVLIEKIVDNASVDIPEAMIETELDYIVRDLEMRMSYQGLRMQDYLKYSGLSIEQLREQRRKEAQNSVKTKLVFEALQKAENIEADEESVNKEIARLAEWAKKPVEEYTGTVTDEQMNYIKNQVIINKMLEFLKQNNTFTASKKKSATKADTKKAAKDEAVQEEKPAKTAPKKSPKAETEATAQEPAPKKKKTSKESVE